MNLWLDDVRDPEKFGRKGWTWVKTVEQAKEKFLSGKVDRASLDHDLGGSHVDEKGKTQYPDGMSPDGNGHDLVVWMDENAIRVPNGVNVHSASLRGARDMLFVLRRRYQSAKWVRPQGQEREGLEL